MKKFDTEVSDFSTGLFSIEELIRSYETYTELRKTINDDSKLKNLFHFLQMKENNLYHEYFRYFRSFVYEQLYDTNLYERNIDLDTVTDKYTEYAKFKPSTLAYYFLRLQEEASKLINIKGANTINYLKEKNESGFVLIFYHWGLFQLLPSVMLHLFNKPIALFAHDEAVLYQRKIINKYYPNLSNNFIGLPTSISSFKKAIKLAKEGCIVCILPELNGLNQVNQNKHNQFVGEEFLGHYIVKPKGPATLSAYSNVPMIRTLIEEDVESDKLLLRFRVLNDSISKNSKDIELATECIWNDLEGNCVQSPHLWGGWEIFDRIKGEDNWLTIQQKKKILN
ncbi:hypothetical protein [Oceanobacillus sp. J11TS1]|uniref:hypothetical protein n=1 Tax=Oceanobacillus sp. J11TS1 TaxID=2807191 RepID=UPI001B0BA1A9|nr:hypothetical protein [Oceanobacillus sp. J11TS1]GIO25024.1 hypothetical protein J11TS1_36050 [Oceanobacillus sp. J11TS1]